VGAVAVVGVAVDLWVWLLLCGMGFVVAAVCFVVELYV
jgi:hypothetical protein